MSAAALAGQAVRERSRERVQNAQNRLRAFNSSHRPPQMLDEAQQHDGMARDVRLGPPHHWFEVGMPIGSANGASA